VEVAAEGRDIPILEIPTTFENFQDHLSIDEKNIGHRNGMILEYTQRYQESETPRQRSNR
jgi:hypothetical protein